MATRTSAPQLRVLIADDHELARAGLRALLRGVRGIRVVGEATDGREALALCAARRPDVVLLDVRMPVMDGLATARSIAQRWPAMRILLVTLYADAETLAVARRAGAVGCVLKDASRQELLTAIRRAAQGEEVHTGGLNGAAEVRLTPREAEVLRLLTQGLSNRRIATVLGLREGTVKTHVAHILAKLGVADRTQAAVRAVEWRLV